MSEQVNIDLNAVINQYEQEQVTPAYTKKIQFDTKNYLQARLGKDEQSKKLTIRLLPFSPNGGTPFEKVHMHTVKVNKELSASGWKTFVCPTNNKKNGEIIGSECPFCDLSAQARVLKSKALDEPTKKKYGDIEFMNKVKDMWIVRCIERGHEEDGVKFWLFSSSKKKDGVYDKIVNLAIIRNEEHKEDTGKEYSIFDVNNGRDLVITLTKTSDGKTSVQIMDVSTEKPLSKDYEQADAWIRDDKKWYEVYTPKSKDYMQIVASGGVPRYSKELGKYIDKEELDKLEEEANEERLNETLTAPSRDYSEIVNADSSTEINGNVFSDNEIDDIPF